MSDTEKKFYIFIKNSKDFVEVSEQIYYEYYRPLWALMKKLQRQGECVCPKNQVPYCDGNCLECQYHRFICASLNEPVGDGEISIGDTIADCSFEKTDLEDEIKEIINSLSEKEQRLCFCLLHDISIKDTKKILKYDGTDDSFYKYRRRKIEKFEKIFAEFKR